MPAAEQWVERFPRPGETCVFSESPAMWRRDALMFDRVYAPLINDWGTNYLPGSDSLEKARIPDIPIDLSFGSALVETRFRTEMSWAGAGAAQGFTTEDITLIGEQFLEKNYAECGVMGTWCTSNSGLYFQRFGEGEVIAYEGALNNIPDVEADVAWEEVRAFREDADSVRKYRDLRLWLKEGLGAQSERHATDIVGQRIDDYRWAIKKHGLRTVSGAISNLWDWKQSVALAAGVGTAATLTGGLVAALVGGIAITSTLGAWLMERKISMNDVRRGEGREVAILVEMQDRFGAR